MNQKKRCRMLSDKISKVLQEGFSIGPDVLHYMDSTFSHPCAEELYRIIDDESNCERDSFIELIFFPDERVQVQLEDFLDNLLFNKEDEAVIAAALMAHKPSISLRFPDNRGDLALVMPESAIYPFIARLNISKKIDHRLLEAVRTFIKEDDRSLCSVKLRNSRFTVSEMKIDFMCRYLGKAGRKGEPFFDELEFILNFLDEVLDDRDMYAALMKKKLFYMRSLHKAEKFEEQIAGKNMETLIMQGMRVPYVNQVEMKKKIHIIDSISLAVFGKTD